MKKFLRALIYLLFILAFVYPANILSQNQNPKKDQSAKAATVKDRDGNVYQTITIGSQVWMAENLKTTKFRNGDPIPCIQAGTSWTELTKGAYCWYNNDPGANKNTYGALYNWFAVNDERKIAPAGWHIPSDEEWATLAAYLKGDRYAGGPLKETQTIHWAEPNTGATNSTGFNALPGGYCDKSGEFKNLGYIGGWWTSKQYTKSVAWYRCMDNSSSFLHNYSTYKNSGFSVRCIKD